MTTEKNKRKLGDFEIKLALALIVISILSWIFRFNLTKGLDSLVEAISQWLASYPYFIILIDFILFSTLSILVYKIIFEKKIKHEILEIENSLDEAVLSIENKNKEINELKLELKSRRIENVRYIQGLEGKGFIKSIWVFSPELSYDIEDDEFINTIKQNIKAKKKYKYLIPDTPSNQDKIIKFYRIYKDEIDKNFIKNNFALFPVQKSILLSFSQELVIYNAEESGKVFLYSKKMDGYKDVLSIKEGYLLARDYDVWWKDVHRSNKSERNFWDFIDQI